MLSKSSVLSFCAGVCLTLLVSAHTAPSVVTEAAAPPGDELAAANWMFVGCIQLGSTCYDVFQDGSGDLWVCKACGQTNNPSPGKCRRLTPWEIQNSLWCS